MKKILMLMQFLAFISLAFSAHASKSSWQVYRNAECGYQVSYPGKYKAEQLKTLRRQFYLDPFSFLQTKQFLQKVVIDKNCIVKIALPIYGHKTNLVGKYLFVMMMDHVPEVWPPAFKGKVVKVGGQQYYKALAQDAAMCHQSNAQYYFLKKSDRYYVLTFVLNSICVGVSKNAQRAYDPKVEKRGFQEILRKFKIQ